MMATTAAGSGHPTSCMSAAELMAGIFFHAMKFDVKDPNSDDSDRFVTLEGPRRSGSLRGACGGGRFPGVAHDDAARILQRTRRPSHAADSRRRCRYRLARPGLSVGAGLAIGARMDKSPTRVYVLLGDGEMAEGQIWEAAEFAGHYKLDNLTVIADVNALGQSEPTMYQHDMETYRRKFESEGFATEVIDGHDVSAVLAALDRAKATKGRPQAIVARTIKGNGVSFCAGKEKWHGKAFSKDETRHGDQGNRRRARGRSARSRQVLRPQRSLPDAAGFSGARRAGICSGQTRRNARSLRFCAEAARRG